MAALLAASVLAGGAAHAQAQLSGAPLEAVLVHHASRLGLEASEVQEIQRVSAQYYQQMVRIQEEMAPSAAAFARAVQAEPPDEAEAMRLLEELGTHELAGRKVRLRAMLHLRSLLDAEQRKELLLIEKELMRDAHGGAPGAGSGAGPP